MLAQVETLSYKAIGCMMEVYGSRNKVGPWSVMSLLASLTTSKSKSEKDQYLDELDIRSIEKGVQLTCSRQRTIKAIVREQYGPTQHVECSYSHAQPAGSGF